MAENSSSSSSSFDSSSSSSFLFSSESSSSHSMSSSSSSDAFSTSSSSSSTSSSSSFDSSSSSSSSYLDYINSKIIPFTYSVDEKYSVECVTFDKYNAYVGTNNKGLILFSENRYNWEKFFIANDSSVSAMLFNNNYLFVGTSPNGMTYRINTLTQEVFSDNKLKGEIIGFCLFNGDIYCALASPTKVFKFNQTNFNWDIFYEAHGTRINQISSYLGKIYLSLNSSNMVSFDGKNWEIEVSEPDNINTIRRVSKNLLYNINYEFKNKNLFNDLNKNERESELEISSSQKLIGVNKFCQDGSTLVLGGSNYGRVLSYSNKKLNYLFETDSIGVSDLLNIDLGVNLVAMRENLYLIYCGEIEKTKEPTQEDEEEDPNLNKTVYINSPNGGENLTIGSTYDISWGSSKSINDSVKLSLYKDDEEFIIITDSTSNNGIFSWEIPITIEEGEDYKIYIEWLSASEEVSEENKDLSDGNFYISYTEDQQSQVVSQEIEENIPNIEKCYGVPILSLNNGEKITFMSKDPYFGGIIIGTSFGRLLHTDTYILNSYMTGERIIYANVVNGYGNTSDTSESLFLYSLYRKVLEINSKKEIKKTSYNIDVTSEPNDFISATFISDILNAQEDLGFWKNIIWSEEKLQGTKIKICLKTAKTKSELMSNEWINCFKSYENENSPIIRELNNINLYGKYAQIKIIMETSTRDQSPSVSDVGLVYSSKSAEYFFTVKFSLENEKNVNKGILTATINQPVGSEIIFGYSDKNSSNWEDYTIIDPENFFNVDDIERVKVGIKMVSYDGSSPSVDEFSVMLNGESGA